MLVALLLIAGFYMAWNIGANDVANAMGTSVGSGALTLRRAILAAAVLEFCGAFFFGSHVSKTLQSGIIHVDLFINQPQTLVLGMVAALAGTGLWLHIASYWGWPVSTTHAIVGALVGFATLVGGMEAVRWETLLFIFVSWIGSPLLGAAFGYLCFSWIRTCIFYAPHPLEAAKKWVPLCGATVLSLLTLMFLIETASHILEVWQLLLCGIAAFTCGYLGGHGLVYYYVGTPHATKKDVPKEDFVLIERMFGWLQIISACMMAFGHGANDVANAIGPLAAGLALVHNPLELGNIEIPSWILAFGGTGIVLGLATWGWRVIETIGRQLTELTPTRGFAAEFSAAVTILLASRLGLPISTTHTLVGAVLGVGLARGIEAINLRTIRDIAACWMITVPAGALAGAFVYLALAVIFP